MSWHMHYGAAIGLLMISANGEGIPGGTLAGGELNTSQVFIAQLPTALGEPILFEVVGQDKISVQLDPPGIRGSVC
jgi:hypothetical protein